MEKSNKGEAEQQHAPQWETLPPYAVRAIEAAAQKVDGIDELGATQEVQALNQFLDREGFLGLQARVSIHDALPVLSHEQVGETDIERVPVVDAQLLGCSVFEGTFLGCSVVQFGENEYWLTYTQSVEVNHDFLSVDSLVGMSTLEVEFPTMDQDDYDEMIAGCFSQLESLEDEDYQDAVSELRKAFEDEDGPLVSRIRTIGIFASILLAHPLHITSEARMQALHTILSYSLDDDIHYKVNGYKVEEELKKDIQSPLLVEYEPALRYVKSVEVTYVTNFEVEESSDKIIKITAMNSLQPAVQFEDMHTHTVLTLPFRFLDSLRSAEPMSDEDYEKESRDLTEELEDDSVHIGDFETCGEQIHEYWRKQKRRLNKPGI